MGMSTLIVWTDCGVRIGTLMGNVQERTLTVILATCGVGQEPVVNLVGRLLQAAVPSLSQSLQLCLTLFKVMQDP